jgi:transaldolase
MRINLPPPAKLEDLQIQIFADGADLDAVRGLADDPLIKGFTTNPSLIRKSGAKDYLEFAKELVGIIPHRPVSIEVLSDEPNEIIRQAATLASLGDNVYVKVPIKNVAGKMQTALIKELHAMGVPLNVTAITTARQVSEIYHCLNVFTPAIVSVFAGRVTDAGIGAKKLMKECKSILKYQDWRLLWASVREPYNIVQAERCGCDIVTVPIAILEKARGSFGASMEEEAARISCQFSKDAREAGYSF